MSERDEYVPRLMVDNTAPHGAFILPAFHWLVFKNGIVYTGCFN